MGVGVAHGDEHASDALRLTIIGFPVMLPSPENTEFNAAARTLTVCGCFGNATTRRGALREGLPEIGFLHQGSPEPEVLMSSFGKGFDDSRVSVDHVKIEHRWADGEYDRLPGLPKDLVDRESP